MMDDENVLSKAARRWAELACACETREVTIYIAAAVDMQHPPELCITAECKQVQISGSIMHDNQARQRPFPVLLLKDLM